MELEWQIDCIWLESVIYADNKTTVKPIRICHESKVLMARYGKWIGGLSVSQVCGHFSPNYLKLIESLIYDSKIKVFRKCQRMVNVST